MDMFKVGYAFVCDDVRQEFGGKVSYIGQTDAIFVPKFPVIINKLCIVYSLLGMPGKYKVSAYIKEKESQKKIIQIPEHDLLIKDKENKIREVFQLHNVKIEKPGLYDVLIDYNETTIVSFTLKVDFLKKQGKVKPDGSMNIPIVLSNN
jgi:hypothetical protein